MKSWKTWPTWWPRPRPEQLQWSHDYEVVENEAARRTLCRRGARLEWSHDYEVVENPIT